MAFNKLRRDVLTLDLPGMARRRLCAEQGLRKFACVKGL